MKAKLFSQWVMRVFLIMIFAGNTLAVPVQSVSAKPLSAPFTNCAAQGEIPEAECLALVALYNSTNGASWTNNTGWLQTDTPCIWYGVSCGGVYMPYVTGLYLHNNQLSGSIPTQIGNLTHLMSIGLSGNKLTGGIPAEIGDLISLTYLDLVSNQLNGNIPVEIGNLTSLQNLFLVNNQLSGGIPSEFGNLTNLTTLWLSGNRLSGEIPASITNLTNLTSLTLSCKLTSTDPVVIAFLNQKSPDWQANQCLGGSITGTVLKKGGGVITDVQISVGAGTEDGAWASAQVSQVDGSYEINGLPDGEYRVEANFHDLGYDRKYYNNAYRWDLATLVTISGGNTVSGINFTLGLGGGISGHVYAQDGVTPVEGVCVNVSSTAPNFNQVVGWGRTGPDGSFSFGGVPVGNMYVRTHASCNGGNEQYLDEWYALGGSVPSGNNASAVQIAAGQLTNNINFSLDTAGSISGTVRDASNNPIQDAQVCANDYDTDDNGNCTQSDASGNYTIGSLRAGDYRVDIRADGWGREYYNDIRDWSSATRVAVTAGSTTPNINFVLEPGGTISGYVYQADGVTPIPDMVVSLDGPGFGDGTCTDTNGAYTLNNVAYGVDWRVRAAPSGDNWCGGSEAYASEYWEESLSWDSATILTLSAGTPSHNNIDFTLEPSGNISGHIYESDGITPVANAWIQIFTNDVNQPITGVTSNGQGYYTFNGIAPGNNYKIQARADGYLRAFYPDVAFEGNATNISVQAGQTTSDMDIEVIKADSYITGRTTYEDGSPAANVWMEAFHQDGWFVGVNANVNGEFTIPVIAGRWKVFPYQPPLIATAQIVDITTGQTVNNKNFVLGEGGSISGKVWNANGQPLQNAQVCATDYDTGVGNCMQSDASGNYTIDSLQSGDYRVQAWIDGWAWEFYNDSHYWSFATRVSVAAGSTTSNINFVLEPGGSISGYIYQADGSTPIAHMAIELQPDTGEKGIKACTDAAGYFAFTSVARGVQWLVSAVPDWRCTGQPEGYIREYWQDARSWDDATVITLSDTSPNYDSVVFTLDQGETTSGVVGATGGIVETQEVSLEVPANAVTEDITFTVTDGGEDYEVVTDEGDTHAVTSAIIGPEGTQFETPATLTFNWPDANSDGIVDGTLVNEGNLYLTKDGTIIAGPCSTDTAHCNMTTNQFTVQVSSLSEFVVGYPVPVVNSITRLSSNPTNAASISFRVTFNKPVTGISTIAPFNDFKLVTTGIVDAAITAVSGSDATYTVTVNTGNGIGTIRLDVPDDAEITDVIGIPLAGLPFTSGTTYSINRSPAAASLNTPKNNIGLDYNPNYTWNKAATATWYRLYVSGASGVVLDQWYEAANICDETTCSVTPGPSYTLGGGSYAWYVQTYNSAGYGPWSNTDANGVAQPTNFTVTSPSTPAAAVLTEPKGNILENYTPTYKWGKVSTATYYRLYVSGPSGVVLDQWYKSADICDAPTLNVCSVASPALVGGNYAWYVQTYNPAGYGPWSNTDANGVVQPTNFNTSTTVPVAAVLTEPKGDITTNFYPAYKWGKVTNATYYRLYVSGPGGVVLDQWYKAADICDNPTAGVCQVPSPRLGVGAHAWYVQTYSPAGYGPWSNTNANGVVQPTNFSTTMPAVLTEQPTLTYPLANILENYNPEYTWNKVTGALYYRLYVSGPAGLVLDQWYEALSICSDVDNKCRVASPTLAGGSYVWYVQSWNPAGYGPWSNTNANGVIQPTNFSTTTTVPVAATLTEPKGDIATNYSPTYKWGKVTNATYYRLYVSGPSGVVLDQWYKAVDICDNPTVGVCQVASPTLVGGSYSWYVQTYSPAGYGPWSNTNANGVVQPTNFNTTIPAVPAAAVLTAPKNDIGTDYNPTYTWPKVATATWYRLYVSGPAGLVLDQWYQASSICGGDNICRVVSPTLAGGAHAWYVQTYNQSGYGPWSNTNASGVVQPTNFSTTVPSLPVGATLTAPTGTITSLTPTYTWGKVSMVTWYRLYVKDSYGVVVDKWYPSVDICSSVTNVCSVVSPTLKRGDHTWWVQTYSGAGYGPWKNKSFTVEP